MLSTGRLDRNSGSTQGHYPCGAVCTGAREGGEPRTRRVPPERMLSTIGSDLLIYPLFVVIFYFWKFKPRSGCWPKARQTQVASFRPQEDGGITNRIDLQCRRVVRGDVTRRETEVILEPRDIGQSPRRPSGIWACRRRLIATAHPRENRRPIPRWLRGRSLARRLGGTRAE